MAAAIAKDKNHLLAAIAWHIGIAFREAKVDFPSSDLETSTTEGLEGFRDKYFRRATAIQKGLLIGRFTCTQVSK